MLTSDYIKANCAYVCRNCNYPFIETLRLKDGRPLYELAEFLYREHSWVIHECKENNYGKAELLGVEFEDGNILLNRHKGK